MTEKVTKNPRCPFHQQTNSLFLPRLVKVICPPFVVSVSHLGTYPSYAVTRRRALSTGNLLTYLGQSLSHFGSNLVNVIAVQVLRFRLNDGTRGRHFALLPVVKTSISRYHFQRENPPRDISKSSTLFVGILSVTLAIIMYLFYAINIFVITSPDRKQRVRSLGFPRGVFYAV